MRIKFLISKLNLLKFFNILFFVGISIFLLLTLKGTVGNPTATYIIKHLEAPGQAFENSPERNRYSELMAMIDYHSFTLPFEVAKTVLPDLGYANGKYISIYPPGFTMVILPFYVIGKLFNISQLATFASSVVFVLISYFLIVKTAQRLQISKSAGVLAVFVFFFATSAWAYTASLYQYYLEIVIFFVVINLLMSKTNFWRSGVIWFLCAYTLVIDNANGIFLLPAIIYFIFKDSSRDLGKKQFKFEIQKSKILSIVFVLPLLFVWMFYNVKVYNRPLTISFSAQSVRRFDSKDNPIFTKQTNTIHPGFNYLQYERFQNGISVLTVSPDRGFLWFSPIMLLSLLGIPLLFKKNKQTTKLLIAMALAIFLVYAAWDDPWGGWAFGPRYLIPVFSILTIFMAQAIDAYKNRIWFLIVFIITGIYSLFINALGAVTSNQVPPLHEATGLNMKYNFFLNWDYLQNNITGSFIYNYFLRNHTPLIVYFFIIFLMVTTIFFILIGINLYKQK